MKKEKQYISIILGIIIIMIVSYYINKQVQEHLLQDDPMLNHLRIILIQVHPIVANLKLYKGDKSYTLNKEKVFLCLQNENGEYYSLNMLIYVGLHEIAHVLCTSQGHTPEFYEIFDGLLKRASDLGVYNDNIPHIISYRGASEG